VNTAEKLREAMASGADDKTIDDLTSNLETNFTTYARAVEEAEFAVRDYLRNKTLGDNEITGALHALKTSLGGQAVYKCYVRKSEDALADIGQELKRCCQNWETLETAVEITEDAASVALLVGGVGAIGQGIVKKMAAEGGKFAVKEFAKRLATELGKNYVSGQVAGAVQNALQGAAVGSGLVSPSTISNLNQAASVLGPFLKLGKLGKGPCKPKKKLPDDAKVVRGGKNRPEDIRRGTGTHSDGVTGVFVESAPGKTVKELSENIPHGQVGVATVGEVRVAGGDVIPTPGRSPNHATMTGLSPEKASELLTPTIDNPARGK
jgi:hypothetical protein